MKKFSLFVLALFPFSILLSSLPIFCGYYGGKCNLPEFVEKGYPFYAWVGWSQCETTESGYVCADGVRLSLQNVFMNSLIAFFTLSALIAIYSITKFKTRVGFLITATLYALFISAAPLIERTLFSPRNIFQPFPLHIWTTCGKAYNQSCLVTSQLAVNFFFWLIVFTVLLTTLKFMKRLSHANLAKP